MDFHGNSVHHIGYGHPRLIEAVARQMHDLCFAPRQYTCEPAVELAEKLLSVAPPGPSKVLFATDGSDAIEIALAYARAATADQMHQVLDTLQQVLTRVENRLATTWTE